MGFKPKNDQLRVRGNTHCMSIKDNINFYMYIGYCICMYRKINCGQNTNVQMMQYYLIKYFDILHYFHFASAWFYCWNQK